jgi:hypothetical protein
MMPLGLYERIALYTTYAGVPPYKPNASHSQNSGPASLIHAHAYSFPLPFAPSPSVAHKGLPLRHDVARGGESVDRGEGSDREGGKPTKALDDTPSRTLPLHHYNALELVNLWTEGKKRG